MGRSPVDRRAAVGGDLKRGDGDRNTSDRLDLGVVGGNKGILTCPSYFF
jgi:hypothetical protein